MPIDDGADEHLKNIARLLMLCCTETVYIGCYWLTDYFEARTYGRFDVLPKPLVPDNCLGHCCGDLRTSCRTNGKTHLI